MLWLHTCAMTRSLSLLVCSKAEFGNQQHIPLRCRHCIDVRTFETTIPRWQTNIKLSGTLAKKICFHCKSAHTRLHVHMPLTSCFPPIWPKLSSCFEIAISEGMVRGNEKGETDWGWSWACGELGGCSLEVCFQFETRLVMPRKGSEHYLCPHISVNPVWAMFV